MCRIRGQPQSVNSFPRSNADVGRVEIGALLGQLPAPLLSALIFFMSEAFGRSPYQVAGAGRGHVPIARLSSDADRPGGLHPIARDPVPR